jgi:flagellar protein FliS
MPNSSLSQYRQSQVSSNAPEKTVLMLYDGAIRFLKNAIREIDENNNIVAKANFIEKTVKILEYLQSCLDSDKGGEIAANLDRLYDYMSIRLTEANLKNDTAKMEEVLNLLKTVREGWNGICDKNGAENQTANYKATAANTGGETGGASHKERKLGIKV